MIRVQKDNVQYQIDENQLAAYEKRGFSVIGGAKDDAQQSGEKPIDRMNKTELLAKAAELDLVVTEGTSNNDIKELIKAALSQ